MPTCWLVNDFGAPVGSSFFSVSFFSSSVFCVPVLSSGFASWIAEAGLAQARTQSRETGAARMIELFTGCKGCGAYPERCAPPSRYVRPSPAEATRPQADSRGKPIVARRAQRSRRPGPRRVELGLLPRLGRRGAVRYPWRSRDSEAEVRCYALSRARARGLAGSPGHVQAATDLEIRPALVEVHPWLDGFAAPGARSSPRSSVRRARLRHPRTSGRPSLPRT